MVALDYSDPKVKIRSTPYSSEAEADLGYGQLFAVLLRRKRWVLGALVAALAIATAKTFTEEVTYVSSMQLLVEPTYKSSQGQGRNNLEGQFSDTGVQVDKDTQITLLRSSQLLERAMAQLQPTYPEFDTSSPAAVQKFRSSLVVAQLNAEGKKDSPTKIFGVQYSSDDPIKTQKVLEALQAVYQEYNLEQQADRLEKGLAFINEQLPEVREKVRDSETALELFRSQQGVIDPESQAQAQVGALNSVDQELQATATQLQELNRRYESLLNQVGLPPEQALLASRLSQSTRYQALLGQIQQTELALIQQRLRFTDQTPQVQQQAEQRQQQLALLGVELSRALNRSVPGGDGEALLYQGQLSGADVGLVNELVAARIALDTAQARYASLQQARRELVARLQRFPGLLAQYSRLLPEIESNRETLRLLLKAREELGLEIARGGFDWQVVESPLYGAPLGQDLKKNLLLGAVAGLMVGGMAAFGREALDDMVHTSDDLQKQVPVPLLGMVPALRVQGSEFGRISRSKLGGEAALAPAMQSILRWTGFREAMDIVQQNIQLVNTAAGLKSMVVTSALPGEGKSTLALGLAFSAARLHNRVLLIDADLRRPSLHKLLNMPNQEGLATFLSGHGPVPMHLLPKSEDGRTGISVLTAGPVPLDPAKLLSSRRMAELIQKFEQHYDLVIVDAPPVLGMVDAMVTASHCGGILMVGRMDRLTKTELSQSLERLRHLNVIGVVANGVSSYRTPYAYVGGENEPPASPPAYR